MRSLRKSLQPQFLDLISRPWSSAEKLERRFDGRIVREAANSNSVAQFIPPVMFYQGGDDFFEFYSVKWVRHEQTLLG